MKEEVNGLSSGRERESVRRGNECWLQAYNLLTRKSERKGVREGEFREGGGAKMVCGYWLINV